MSDESLNQQLSALLKETGKAHHQAFFDVDGYDPEWPIWYAEYATDRLNALLNTALTKSEVVYLLILVENQRKAEEAPAAWYDYYATHFLAHNRLLPGWWLAN